MIAAVLAMLLAAAPAPADVCAERMRDCRIRAERSAADCGEAARDVCELVEAAQRHRGRR